MSKDNPRVLLNGVDITDDISRAAWTLEQEYDSMYFSREDGEGLRFKMGSPKSIVTIEFKNGVVNEYDSSEVVAK